MNQKLTITILAVAVALMATYAFIWKTGSGKVVYVETGVLIEKYEGMQKARLEIEARTKEMKADIDSIINIFQDDMKDYEKNRQKMSAKERELKEELLHVRQQQVSNYQKSIQSKINEEQQQITQAHLNRINNFIKEYGKQMGFKYILGANGSGNIVYAEDALNITNDILEGLNVRYRKEFK